MKEQSHHKITLKSQPTQSTTIPKLDNPVQQQIQAGIIQRTRLDPKLLLPRDVAALQRTLGNRTIGQLLTGTVANQPATGGKQPLRGRSDNTLIQRITPGEIIPSLQHQAKGHFQENKSVGEQAEAEIYQEKSESLLKQVMQLDQNSPLRKLYFEAINDITRQGLYFLSREGFLAVEQFMLTHRKDISLEIIQKLFTGSKIDKTEIDLKKTDIGKAFMEARKNVGIKKKLGATEAKQLTTLLSKTQFIQNYLGILSGKKDDEKSSLHSQKAPKKEAQWKTGRSLHETKISYSFTEYEEDSGYQPMKDPAEEYPEVLENLKQADRIVKAIVDPEVLNLLPPPKVRMVNVFGHRAYQDADSISVGLKDSTSVIVHEVGHYLESNLPSELWHDVAILREVRHEEALPLLSFGNKREAVKGPLGLEKEGRYRGTYKATGEYTSKVYETSGATEIVSMTMEYLADPDTLEKLLTQDPLQAAIVLRRLRPTDSELQAIFEIYKDYLPNDLSQKATGPQGIDDVETSPQWQMLEEPLLKKG